MHDGVAVLTKALEVVEREGDVGVVDVLWREVDDVVHNLGGLELAVGVASLARAGRDDAERRVDWRLHVRLAVMQPSRRMIEGDRPVLCHYDPLCSGGPIAPSNPQHVVFHRLLYHNMLT